MNGVFPMAIDRSKVISSMGSVIAFGGNIVTGILTNFFLYRMVLAPDYKAILIGAIIAIVIGVGIYLVIAKEIIPERYHVKSAIVLGVLLGIVIGMVIPPFPLFEITSPTDNSAVGYVISVRGHGGIPDSKIQVFVITDYLYPQAKAYPDAAGEWTVFPVFIGEERHFGLEAEIYAEMTTPDGKVYRSNFIKVKRKAL